MNEEEIAAFMKESNKKRLDKERLDEQMSKFKDSDFNENLKSEYMKEESQGIGWLFAEKKSECFHCGMSTNMYRLFNAKKQFACTSCWYTVKK